MRSLSHAEKLLQSLGITQPDEIDLEAIAWDRGAEVRYRILEGCEARILGVDNKAIISIHSEVGIPRRRFSIAHELGHWQYHKGRSFMCRKKDIGNYSNAHMNDPERIADKYAADLILPLYIFKGVIRQYKLSNFDTIGDIANLFNVSMTATAIRYVEYGDEPCMLICHSQRGREWFIRHKDVPQRLFPKKELDHDSSAFEVVFGEKEKTNQQIIGADAWFDLSYANEYILSEQTFSISKCQSLTLLTWKNDSLFQRVA
jgi:hypothetical protein